MTHADKRIVSFIIDYYKENIPVPVNQYGVYP